MPIHDWTRVEAGIFHAFHHDWITEIARALNRGMLPADFYALPEQFTSKFGPDVLTLQAKSGADDDSGDVDWQKSIRGGTLVAAPKLRPVGETDMDFYRRKQKVVAIRHSSGDRIVAVIEIVSPGNKSGQRPFDAFIKKAGELLDRGIHLLIVDLLPPSRRDPNGIHGAIWEAIAGEDYVLPKDKPLTFVSYECDLITRAYALHAAVGELLPDTPLFLAPQETVTLPLEKTYELAFVDLPQRWKRVLEPTAQKRNPA